eukprot:18506-Chlamydomonas_euryale.AAC.2
MKTRAIPVTEAQHASTCSGEQHQIPTNCIKLPVRTGRLTSLAGPRMAAPLPASDMPNQQKHTGPLPIRANTTCKTSSITFSVAESAELQPRCSQEWTCGLPIRTGSLEAMAGYT